MASLASSSPNDDGGIRLCDHFIFDKAQIFDLDPNRVVDLERGLRLHGSAHAD